ncbi:hypothetical protein FHX15_004684 [Rhizobium sp. BK650]|uniref:HD domain-containing protein n=1 Tax=Rhizobium sp. BK650 TaxID=2586990 RepID=UPI0016218593|nr:HD domain-containing protein [Rhizobium sp. BK650]MBB3659420.1 hypothetical protein [Rhizobium sp. BK650]
MAVDRRRILAGVVVPDTEIVRKALKYAEKIYEPYLFNHVMRSWLFAASLAKIQNVDHDEEVVALGTLLHDVTLNPSFRGPRRFEVEGADIARRFAWDSGVVGQRAQLVWDSVALNSTPSIGLYKEPEVALCTGGICLDVVGLQYSRLAVLEMKAIVEAFPRLGLKKKMTSCFCHMVENAPETTYDNFLCDFGYRYVPGYEAPSSVDFVMNAPFDS